MEILRNRIDVKFLNNKYLKCTSKTSDILRKIFGNNLFAKCKRKVALKLNKLAYIEMSILEFSKVLMYELHYNYIKNKYENKSKLLIIATDSLIYEIKTQDIYEDFSSNKEMFDFSNCSTKSKPCNDRDNLAIGKMKDETGGTAIESIFELKPKMYSFLVDDNSKHKKEKCTNRNI